ncbi:MAG: hypothetical protein KGK44_06930, partial [Gammaproteobacteria bacterium]|nr:hypothetical protein [Gammaproteobacteria bacterium]
MFKTFAYLLLTMSLATPNIIAAEGIPTSAFFRHTEYSQVKISPDGRYLAVVSTAPGEELSEQLSFI